MPGSSRIERLRAMLGAKETHPEEIQANPKAVDANTPPTNTKIEKFSGTASGQEQVIFQHAVHPMVASSHKTAIIQKTTASVESTETVKDIKNEAEFGSVKGKPASVGGRFSPFLAVTKLCYKYCPRALLQPISVEFFASGKIFERGWDMLVEQSYFYRNTFTLGLVANSPLATALTPNTEALSPSFRNIISKNYPTKSTTNSQMRTFRLKIL